MVTDIKRCPLTSIRSTDRETESGNISVQCNCTSDEYSCQISTHVEQLGGARDDLASGNDPIARDITMVRKGI
jgi:hypothetical protein